MQYRDVLDQATAELETKVKLDQPGQCRFLAVTALLTMEVEETTHHKLAPAIVEKAVFMLRNTPPWECECEECANEKDLAQHEMDY